MVTPRTSLTQSDPTVMEGANILLRNCGSLKSHERVVIVCDETTRELGYILENQARPLAAMVQCVEIPVARMHGQEPPPFAAAVMKQSDLCLGITSKSMAHTAARMALSQAGSRYLSLPDYTLSLLADSSLRANFQEYAKVAQRLADLFTEGRTVRVTTPLGTDISMSIDGRVGNCCPGYVAKGGDLGSPPDIESNVSPIENSAHGLVIVDGSIPYPGIGLLKTPITLMVRGGRITQMNGSSRTVKKLKVLFASANSPKAYILAECGIGLNKRSVLSGVMLTDEGAAGTMHFGFGSNATVGGKNDVPFHLDFVFREPTLEIDGCVAVNRGVYDEVL